MLASWSLRHNVMLLMSHGVVRATPLRAVRMQVTYAGCASPCKCAGWVRRPDLLFAVRGGP